MGGGVLHPVHDETLSGRGKDPEDFGEDLPGMGQLVEDVDHPHDLERPLRQGNPVLLGEDRPDAVAKGLRLKLAIEVFDHSGLKLHGMTDPPPGEDLRHGKEKIAGSGADFCRISPIEGTDQREKEGRILKGLPLGIVKPCDMLRVKEMGQEDLLQGRVGSDHDGHDATGTFFPLYHERPPRLRRKKTNACPWAQRQADSPF